MQITRTQHSAEVTGLQDYELQRPLTIPEHQTFTMRFDFAHYDYNTWQVQCEEGTLVDELHEMLNWLRAL